MKHLTLVGRRKVCARRSQHVPPCAHPAAGLVAAVDLAAVAVVLEEKLGTQMPGPSVSDRNGFAVCILRAERRSHCPGVLQASLCAQGCRCCTKTLTPKIPLRDLIQRMHLVRPWAGASMTLEMVLLTSGRQGLQRLVASMPCQPP